MNLIKIFLASPSDTQDEREAVKSVVTEINLSLRASDDLRFELLTWETATYPSFGAYPQAVINEQIGDYDIFVGIMWKTFGTPTGAAGSGTEEEFNRAYDNYTEGRCRRIMFYFNESHIPQNSDFDEFGKVKAFKKRLSEMGGLYATFDTVLNFEKTLRNHFQLLKNDLLKELNSLALNEPDNIVNISTPELSSEFSSYLNSVGATFSHSRADQLNLDDIFVPVNLRNITSVSNSPNDFTTIEQVIDDLADHPSYTIIVGREYSGKTTACKYIVSSLYNLGYYPLLLNGNDFGSNIRPEALIKILQKKMDDQYVGKHSVTELCDSKVVVIVDDFVKATKGKTKYWHHLIKNLRNNFNRIVVTGNNLIMVEPVDNEDPFNEFNYYSILELGPKLRYDLVNKWNSIGQDSRFIDHNDMIRVNEDYISHIKSVLGTNFIPAYPFYLLTMLQALESGHPNNPNYSIHGFYFEVLINDCLGRAVKDNKEISLYHNYLTQFCYHMFQARCREISLAEFQEFHKQYCLHHDLTYSYKKLLTAFSDAKLLDVNGKVSIRDKYVYYFFVAKYISGKLLDDNVKSLVTKMCNRIFRDEYASIIMFVTHLSKDNFIINQLITTADSIFENCVPTKLAGDIAQVNSLIDKIPGQVMKNVSVGEQRLIELDEEEKKEQIEKQMAIELDGEESLDDVSLDEDVSGIDVAAEIIRALKTIDILGQVTKKHWGELNGAEKFTLASTTYNLSLRTLDYYFKLILNSVDDLTKHIGDLVKQKHLKDRHSLEKGVAEIANHFLFRLCFMVTFGVIKRTAYSIGYDKLKTTFEKVLNSNPECSVKLIDLAIKLGYSNIATHMDAITKYNKEMSNNKVCNLVLQNLAIDYMYMFETDHTTKHKICTELKISVQKQVSIDQSSRVKRKRR